MVGWRGTAPLRKSSSSRSGWYTPRCCLRVRGQSKLSWRVCSQNLICGLDTHPPRQWQPNQLPALRNRLIPMKRGRMNGMAGISNGKNPLKYKGIDATRKRAARLIVM